MIGFPVCDNKTPIISRYLLWKVRWHEKYLPWKAPWLSGSVLWIISLDQVKIPGGQRFCGFKRRRAEGSHLRAHSHQGRQPGRQHGLPGHHATPPDRPDRFPLRPDLRLRRQGYPRDLRSGLFRQLHQIILRGSSDASRPASLPGRQLSGPPHFSIRLSFGGIEL